NPSTAEALARTRPETSHESRANRRPRRREAITLSPRRRRRLAPCGCPAQPLERSRTPKSALGLRRRRVELDALDVGDDARTAERPVDRAQRAEADQAVLIQA